MNVTITNPTAPRTPVRNDIGARNIAAAASG
jgi:hypothetical protein